MPIKKYRRLEDAPERWLAPWDHSIGARMRFVCEMATRLAGPRALPRGVRKYRSFEELLTDRERWEDERIARIRAERMHKLGSS
ncbi:MAG: hypothetical protein JOZ54_02430 [Acidobacteria bacterium]|nr:hypothetical protein [Acidobacteriota bacterium]